MPLIATQEGTEERHAGAGKDLEPAHTTETEASATVFSAPAIISQVVLNVRGKAGYLQELFNQSRLILAAHWFRLLSSCWRAEKCGR